MVVETYESKDQSELGLTDEEWETLRSYVETIAGALEAEATDVGGVAEVEEDPPSFDVGKFRPGGWVGLYPGGVTVVPSHISEEEYHTLLNETQRWIEIIGATTIATTFPLSADILVDARTRLAAYSKALIEFSESLQRHRLPVEIRRTRRRGREPEGRPLFEETIRKSAQGSRKVVSEEVQFSFDTLLNHLLVRFHVELLTEMRDLADQYHYYEAAFSSQIDYHQDFVETGIPSRFVDTAVQTDFSSPSVIAEARREATDEMADIVDLWEAFQRDIGMELTLSDNLDTAVKPISKLYELWCLGLLLDVLSELCGQPPTYSTSITREYRFGDGLVFHYNRSLGRFSQYFKDNLGVRHGPGQPDFALEFNDEIVWIGDAKFKTSVKLPDYRRFLSYVVDLLPPERTSTILYVEEDALGREYVRDYPIDHLCLRPETAAPTRDDLTTELRHILTTVGAL